MKIVQVLLNTDQVDFLIEYLHQNKILMAEEIIDQLMHAKIWKE